MTRTGENKSPADHRTGIGTGTGDRKAPSASPPGRKVDPRGLDGIAGGGVISGTELPVISAGDKFS